MDSVTIRETFLRFFEERGHRRYASAPLIPNDPTLLLTIAGMVPFKPYFLGDAVPPSPRAASCQKCVRTNDIENVGRTTRHMSFFEMLGNFSFGDYFKREAIQWAWELSIEPFGLDPERIWVTIHETDDQAEQLWLELSDVPAERIVRVGAPAGSTRLDASDNFWSTGGAGPCGPCTELHYDRGEDWGEPGGPEVNGERYLEYYNLVFMQSLQDDDGTVLGDLPKPSVDTGLGLERLALLLQGGRDAFDTDVLRPMVDQASELTGASYGGTREGTDLSLRVIAEHARASTFLIADGVLPAKEGRGYVLRRLLRRAVRHAHLLGFDGDLMVPMIGQVIATMAPAYPELERQRELVTRVAAAEQVDFQRVLAQGLEMVDEAVAAAHDRADERFPGDVAFRLHDTFGFPIDLTAELAEDAGLELDREGFDELMQEQRLRARSAAKRRTDEVPVEVYREAAAELSGSVEFVGYETTTAESRLGALIAATGVVAAAQEGDELEVVLPRTPFYAEGGGQVGDRGVLETPTGRLEVLDTQEAMEGLIVHQVRVTAGEVVPGQDVHAVVDASRREATARSHSATHVLHATIKELLGSHAQQAGSHVEPGRLRFDFPHFDTLKGETLNVLEETVNARVLHDPHVTTEIMPIDAAKAAGAVANFGDKYGDVVRVVTIGDFSKELCGGTHVHSGATIGPVFIVREESIGANTRRIEALTGLDAYRHVTHERQVAEEIARLFDTSTDQAVERVADLMTRLKGMDKQLARLRASGLTDQAHELASNARRLDGLAVVTAVVDGVTGDELRRLATETRALLAKRGIVVLGSATDDGKAQLVGAVTADLVEAGVEARPIVQPAAQVVGGGAGGHGELAQAGGRDGSRLAEALELAARTARELAGS